MGVTGRRAVRAAAVERARPSTSRPVPESVEVHIEHLVLHGFDRADRYVAGDALTAELGRLLGESGVPDSLTDSADVDLLKVSDAHLPAAARGEGIGIPVAEAIYRGLGAPAGEKR
jgi:hypothetical protein